MITVQPIRCPAYLLRLIDDRRSAVRSDGLPPFTASCLLVPTDEDPTIAEVCAMVLADHAALYGWHIRAQREVREIAGKLGFRRLVANTDGRLWPEWEAMDAGWIGIDLEAT